MLNSSRFDWRHLVDWWIGEAGRLIAAEARQLRHSLDLVGQQRAPQKGLFFLAASTAPRAPRTNQDRKGRAAVDRIFRPAYHQVESVRSKNASRADAFGANTRFGRSFGRRSVDRASADMLAGKTAAVQHQGSGEIATLEGCPVA